MDADCDGVSVGVGDIVEEAVVEGEVEEAGVCDGVRTGDMVGNRLTEVEGDIDGGIVPETAMEKDGEEIEVKLGEADGVMVIEGVTEGVIVMEGVMDAVGEVVGVAVMGTKQSAARVSTKAEISSTLCCESVRLPSRDIIPGDPTVAPRECANMWATTSASVPL